MHSDATAHLFDAPWTGTEWGVMVLVWLVLLLNTFFDHGSPGGGV